MGSSTSQLARRSLSISVALRLALQVSDADQGRLGQHAEPRLAGGEDASPRRLLRQRRQSRDARRDRAVWSLADAPVVPRFLRPAGPAAVAAAALTPEAAGASA